MDYKYIEQLLERYWACETSQEEESILKTFFSQKELPDHLARYRDLFVYEQLQSQLRLGDDFERRILEAVGEAPTEQKETKTVQIKHVTLGRRLRPLYRAAAAVAIVTLLGTAAQHSFQNDDKVSETGWDYNRQAYKDSYEDPQKAYEVGMKALEMFKQGPQTAVADSARQKNAVNNDSDER